MKDLITLNWSDFKTNVTSRNLNLQWFIKNDSYHIYAFDGKLKFFTSIDIEIVGEESADQLDFEANFKANGNKALEPRTTDGVPLNAPSEIPGKSHSLPSHDFTDPTTWYGESVRVTSETPTLVSGTTYSLLHSNIIDVRNKKITREDKLESTYGIVIKDGTTTLTENTDYTVDFVNGQFTLNVAPSGSLSVDYSYANGSSFTISPPSGKVYKIKESEIQFTKDVIMKPVIFEFWVFNPSFDPNLPESPTNPLRIRIDSESDTYNNYKDIINIARRGTGQIPIIPGFSSEIIVFPFEYTRIIDLKSSQGMQIKIRLVDETPMIGEWGTMTFYVIEEDEV